MGIDVQQARRVTDLQSPGEDFLGGSNPCNPYAIVGAISHQTGAGGRLTLSDAGTTGLTIDNLLHLITHIEGHYADGTSYVVRKEDGDITVDEANNRVSWTRSDNGAGVEKAYFKGGLMGAIAGYAAAGA